MPAEINIPVRLELLKSSINELQNVLSNLKPNTQSFRTISRYIQDMTKEMTQFQALTSRAFSNQSQFNRGNKSIERMETILDKAKIAMSEIKFPEIKLSGEQQAQWDSLNKTLEDTAAKFEQIKEKVKGNILSDSTTRDLFSNMDPKYMEKNFDQLFDMVDRKTQELSRKMVNAKQKLAEFNGQKTSQGKRIESLTTNGISPEAIGQAAFDRFFTRNDKGEAIFKKAGAGETPMKQQFLEYLKEIYSLSDADISKLQADLGQKGGVAKLNKIFTSMGKDNMFTKALEKSTFAKSDKLQRSLTEAEDAYNKYQELLNKFQTASNTGTNGAGAGEVGAAFTEFQQKAQAAREAILAFSTDTERAFSNNGIKKGIDQGNTALENYRNTLKSTNAEYLRYEQASRTFSNMKMAIGNFMGFYQVLNLTKRAVKEAASHIKDLDSVMNKISIVTDMSTGDLWNQIDAYSQMAQKYGVSIKGAYEVSQIYYQQGLKQSEVLTLTNETLKLSKISGLDYAESTDYMTTAIRGFKLEAADASRVVDVYSNLASHTAVTQGELAIGMSKTASSLESVGASFEESSAMIATMVAVTRESSTNIGSAMKSIAARYGEMKKDISSMTDEEGEALSYNKVDTALQSVGISLKNTDGQFRNFTDVIIELGEKWDTLDSVQQRYIATQFAGNRQQSRFLALVSNVDLLKSNLAYAEDSKNTGDIQALKTLDSIETKQEQLKVAYQQMYTSIGAEDMWKGALGGLTDFMNTLNGLPKLFGKIPIGAISMIGDIVMVLKSAGRSLLSGISNIVLKSLPADAMAAKVREAVDSYRQAIQSETEKKAPELQKTGQELSNQIEKGTQKAQNDLNQPAAKPEVAEQAMKPAEKQAIDTATQSQMNAASAQAEADALAHRNQVLAEGTEIAEANASATSATADANREASAAATEQTNAQTETAQLTLPMATDNKPVLEAAQQARDAIASEPATMKIVGESSINSNSGGGAPTSGGQALAGGNVQVLMGELGPEMYVSNGQYFIAGQSGPEMVSLPPDAIVFNHLQTDDLLRKESTFGTGHPITNERNAVAMAGGNVDLFTLLENQSFSSINGENLISSLSSQITAAAAEAVNMARQAGISIVNALESSMKFDNNSFDSFKASIIEQIESLGPEIDEATKSMMKSVTSNMTLGDFNQGLAPKEFYQWAGRWQQEFVKSGVAYGSQQIDERATAETEALPQLLVLDKNGLTEEQLQQYRTSRKEITSRTKQDIAPLQAELDPWRQKRDSLEDEAATAYNQIILDKRRNGATDAEIREFKDQHPDEIMALSKDKQDALREARQNVASLEDQIARRGSGVEAHGDYFPVYGKEKLELTELNNTYKQYGIANKNFNQRIEDQRRGIEFIRTSRQTDLTKDSSALLSRIANDTDTAEKRSEAIRQQKEADAQKEAERLKQEEARYHEQYPNRTEADVRAIADAYRRVQKEKKIDQEARASNESIDARRQALNQEYSGLKGIFHKKDYLEKSRILSEEEQAADEDRQRRYKELGVTREDRMLASEASSLKFNDKTLFDRIISEQKEMHLTPTEPAEVPVAGKAQEGTGTNAAEQIAKEASDKPAEVPVVGKAQDDTGTNAAEQIGKAVKSVDPVRIEPVSSGIAPSGTAAEMLKLMDSSLQHQAQQQQSQTIPASETKSSAIKTANNGAEAVEESASQAGAAFQNLYTVALQATTGIKGALSNLIPHSLTGMLGNLETSFMNFGTKVINTVKNIPNQMGSFGMALTMISNLLNKTSRGGQVAAGAIMTLGGAIRTFDALSKAAAGSNPWLAIAMGVMAVVNGINMMIETDEEKIERLDKEAEETNNKAKQATADYKSLKNTSTKLDELKEKRYDNAEAAEEYQTAVDDLAEKFPGLIEGFDEAGNIIINTTALEDELAAARQKAADATYNAAKAEREAAEEKLKQSLNSIQSNKMPRNPNESEATTYLRAHLSSGSSSISSLTEEDWKKSNELPFLRMVETSTETQGRIVQGAQDGELPGLNYKGVISRFEDQANYTVMSPEVAQRYLNALISGGTYTDMEASFKGSPSNYNAELYGEDKGFQELLQDDWFRDENGLIDYQTMYYFISAIEKGTSTLKDLTDEEKEALDLTEEEKKSDMLVTDWLGKWSEENEFAGSWDWLKGGYDIGDSLLQFMDDTNLHGLNHQKTTLEVNGTSQELITSKEPIEQYSTQTTELLNDELKEKLSNKDLLNGVSNDIEVVAKARDALASAIDSKDIEQMQKAYSDLRIIEQAVKTSTNDDLSYLQNWFINFDEIFGEYGTTIEEAIANNKATSAARKKEISAKLNQIYSGVESFYDDESGLTNIITSEMYDLYEKAKKQKPDLKLDQWMNDNIYALSSQYGLVFEEFWTGLGLDQQKQLSKMLKETDKYSFNDIISEFNIDPDSPIYKYLQNYYDKIAQNIQDRLKKKFSDSEWFGQEASSKMQAIGQKFRTASGSVTTTREEKYLNDIYSHFDDLAKSGYAQKARDYAEQGIQLLTDIQGITDLTLRDKVFSLVETNGINTIEGINKSIASIKADTSIDDKTRAKLLTDFEEAKNNIITNVSLALQAASDNFLESWEKDSKTLAKLNSGIDLRDVDSLLKTDAAKAMNGGKGLNISDFIMDGNKLILSAEKSSEYIDKYFESETASLKEYEAKIKKANDALKDKEFEEGSTIKEDMQEQIETLIGVGSLKKYAELKDGVWTVTNAKDLNAEIKKGYEQAQDNLISYGKYLEVSKEQAIKTLQWQQGDYSSLKSIYKNFKKFKFLNDTSLTLEINKRLAQLVSGAEQMTEEEYTQPDIKNAVEQIRSAYGNFIDDLINKDLSSLYATDYIQTGLGKDNIAAAIADAQEMTAIQFALWISDLADQAGQTLAEQNDRFLAAWNKEHKQQTAEGIKDVQFYDSTTFGATEEQLKTFADTYNLKISDLVDQGIAYYSEALGTWIVDITSIDTSKIEGFEDVVADSVNAFFDKISTLIKNGLDGSLNNADKSLLQIYADMFGLEGQLDFTETANGLKLSETSAIKLYYALSQVDKIKAQLVFDELSESLQKNNENFKTTSALAAHIAKIRNGTYAADSNVSSARLRQYEAELEIANQILKVRSTTEDSSFNFMSNKIPGAQNNPLNYAKNWTQAFQTIRDAYKVKKAGKSGFMDYTDWYNIVTEMNNIAALGGPIELAGVKLDGSMEAAAELIQKGAEALTTVDTGELKVNLGAISADLSSSASFMQQSVTDGIQAMAKSQVKMLDGLIAMLELIVQMEALGDIDTDKNGIDLSDLFEVTYDENGKQVNYEKFSADYKKWVDDIKDKIKKDSKNYNEDLANAINGITLHVNGEDIAFAKILEWDESAFQDNQQVGQVYASLINAMVQAAKSGNYDLDNIAQSVQQELTASGVFDTPLTVNIGNTSLIFTSEGSTSIQWDSTLVQNAMKGAKASKEELITAVTKYVSGEQLTETELTSVLILHNKIKVVDGVPTVTYKGETYTDEIPTKVLGALALEDAGFKEDDIELRNEEAVTHVKSKTEVVADMEVTADGTGIHYHSTDGNTYGTLEQAIEGNYNQLVKDGKDGDYGSLEAYAWEAFGQRKTIKTKAVVMIDDVETEVDLTTSSKYREGVLEGIGKLTENDIQSDGKGNYICKLGDLTISLDAEEVELNGDKDLGKTKSAILKSLGLDQLLEENISRGIQDAIPSIIKALNDVDATNLRDAATELSNMFSALQDLQGVSYDQIAEGLSKLGIHWSIDGAGDSGITPEGGNFEAISSIIESLQTIDPSGAKDAAKYLNDIKSAPAENAKNALNSISIEGKNVQATANIVVQVVKGLTGPTKAKGNIALAAGTPTLMGELGPELVVSNGKYFVAGQSGAEFVNLQKDAIVFNHKQTANLLNNGSIGSRGKPFTNETNAISFAKGNYSGPALTLGWMPAEWGKGKEWTYTYNIQTSFGGVDGHLWQAPIADITLPASAKGNVGGGPAKASASAALAALKQLRAQWQALAGLSAKDLAGKGGGGGGGGKPANFIKDLERWYNLLQQIAKLEQQITYQETLRNKLASDLTTNGEAYVKSQAKSLKDLQDEVAAAQQLALEQEDYFILRQKQLNEQSAFKELYTFDEDGQIKYASGKFAQLSEMFGGDDTTGAPNHTVKEQYDYLISQGYGYAMQYDSSGNEIKIKDKNDESNMKAAIEAFWAKIDSDKQEMQELHDSIEDQKTKVLEKMQAQNELLKEVEDNQITVEGKVLKALEDSRQREIDDAKDERDIIEKSAQKLIDGLSDQLQKEQDMYSSQQEADELQKLQRQLAIAQRSGGSAAVVADLQQQIAEKQQSIYFDTQQKQIDALQEASDNELERLDHQIELMQETLDYQKENGLLWTQVAQIMEGSPEEIAEYIKQNDSDYWSKSPTEMTKQFREDIFDAQKYVAYRDTVSDEIRAIAKLLTSQNLDTEWNQFSNMMANSNEYKDAWGKLSDDQKNKLKAIYAEELSSSGDPNAAARKVWESQEAQDYGITKKKEEEPASTGTGDGTTSGTESDGNSKWTVRYDKKTGRYVAIQDPNGTYSSYSAARAKRDEMNALSGSTMGIGSETSRYTEVDTSAYSAKVAGKDTRYIGIKKSDGTYRKTGTVHSQAESDAWKKNNPKKADESYVGGYSSGGLNTIPGLAMLHGTQQKPEAVLNAAQTKILRDNILSNRPDSLVSLLKSYNEAYHGLSQATYDSITDSSNITTIERAEVNLQIEKLADDYDSKRAANTIMEEMLRIASKTKANNSVRR